MYSVMLGADIATANTGQCGGHLIGKYYFDTRVVCAGVGWMSKSNHINNFRASFDWVNA